MPQQVATQLGNGPRPSVFPEGAGVCIAGFVGQGVYRVVQSYNLKNMMDYLQARTPFPLEIADWLPGTYVDSKRQGDQLRRLFRDKRTRDGWFRLSADHLALARHYLAEDKERLAREAECARQRAARKLEQARQDVANAQGRAAKAQETATDECLHFIRRIRTLTEGFCKFLEQESAMAWSIWPEQQATDECLKLVVRFHVAAGKFDMALSRKAMEVQLARMPKDDVLSVM